MLRCVRYIFALFISVSALMASQWTDAAEINTTTYDIYLGDVNGDGYSDYYFVQKPLFVLLHDDIATPLLIKGPTFAIYGGGSTYSVAQTFSLSDDQVAAKLASGQLKRASLSTDVFIWSTGIAGQNNIFLRGADASSPALLLTNYFTNTLPSTIKTYSPSAYPGISDRSVSLSISDINGDGQKDILLGSYISDSAQTAYLADSSGTPVKFFEVTPSTARPTVVANVVGTTAGQFRVDESGSATYNIPISFAPGVAGVTPQLSLNYSNQAGNGLAGKGWSLSGLSSITRCRQTLGQDGAAKPVNWTTDDRFCFNGQRLMLTSGTYGSASSTYKTELDSFAKITLLNDASGNIYFTIDAKDGSTSTYGRTSDSRLIGSSSAPATVLTWSINRFEDNVKNGIDYIYEGDASSGQRIKYINYAFPNPNTSSSALSRTDGNAQVAFVYESRPDITSAYVAGYQFTQSKRLVNINVSNKGSSLRTFTLSYMSSAATDSRYQDSVSRLQTVQECQSTKCLPPTSFSWGGGNRVTFDATPNQQVNFTDTTAGKFVINNLFADVTGDGKQDLVYLMYDVSKATSTYPNRAQVSVHIKYAQNNSESVIGLGTVDFYNLMKIATLDYNADGRQDLAVYDGSAWKIYLSTPRSDGTWIIDAASTLIVDSALKDSNTAFVDINGDGLADVVTKDGYRLLIHDTTKAQTSNTYYKFGDFTAFQWDDDSKFIGAYQSGSAYVGGSYTRNCQYKKLSKNIVPISTSDFNADGVADFIATVGIVYDCEVTSGGSSPTPPVWTHSDVVTSPSYTYAMVTQNIPGSTAKKLVVYPATSASPQLPMYNQDAYYTQDINGDGLTDIIYADSANKFYFKINTGTGFSAPTEWVTLPVYSTAPLMAKPQFIDVNGDGLLDISWNDRTTNTLNVRLWGANQNSTVISTSGAATDSHFLMDVSGDGVLDYLKITSTNMYNYTGKIMINSAVVPAEQLPSAVTSITNGLGAVTTINYGTLSNSGHYSTTDVNLSTTQVPTNNPYCSGGVTNMYCPQLTYTVTDSGSFYSRLNGGWELPSGSKTLITDNSSKGAPVLEVNGSMQIVASVETSAPAASITSPQAVNQTAKSKMSYFYGEAKMQGSGRGFLGFNKLITVDEQSGLKTTTTYRQDFPFIGSPLSTVVYSDGSSTAKLLSKSTNTWDFTAFTGTDSTNYFQTNLQSSNELSYDLSAGTLLQTVSTSSLFDAYGNVTQITAVTSGKKLTADTTLTKVTTNIYGASGVADYNNIYGRLTQSSVTTTRDTEPSVTRTSSFTYYDDSDSNGAKGLLKTETAEPSNSAGVTSEYRYDRFGNKIKTLVTAINSRGVSETRATTSVYDPANGRDLLSTTNNINQQAQITGRNEYNEPTAAIDINSISSHVYYDEMGQEYMRKDDTGAWTRTQTSFCDSGCPAGAKFKTAKRVAGGSIATDYFDLLGRTIRSSKLGFDGRTVNVDTEYDNAGRTKRQSTPYFDGSAPSGWIQNDYDILGRIVKVTQPDGSFSSSAYSGYTITSTNPLNQTRTETRNGLGQLIKVADHLGGTIDYEYDLQGGLLKATTTADGISVVVRMCYDTFGRKVAMFDDDKGGFRGNAALTCAQVAASRQPGWWYYTYDGFGELTSQVDTKNQTTTMVYDTLGRVVGRTDILASGAIEGFTQWFYERGVDGSAAATQGKLTAVVMNTDPSLTTAQINSAITSGIASCNQNSISCHKTLYNFDIFSRPTDSTVYYPGSTQAYISRTAYDIFGRVSRQYDAIDRILNLGVPLDSGVQTAYNDYGYAYKSSDIGSGETLQQTTAVNERGQITSEYRGNGVTSNNTYDIQTGQLTDQQSGIGSLFSVQNIHYKWDVVGNLKYRDNQSPFKSGGGGTKNRKESFCYDSLNRLVKTVADVATLTPSCTGQDVTYNGLGNITYKRDVGTYSYGVNAGHHAVTSTDGSTYTYDSNGNQVSSSSQSSTRNIVYTTYDQPALITKDGASTAFSYGPDRSRWQRRDVKNNVTTVTTYLGNVERIEQLQSGVVEWKRYVNGAIYTYKTTTSNQVQVINKSYVYNDHLGSIDVVTDAAGTIQQSLSFDAWGARRNGENWSAFNISELNVTGFTQAITRRGFTGHEMLDDMGLIHMNGRIYDAKLGRFLQADPFIQAATNTQSYNRYSYVLNNPLNMTDPSGFNFFKKLWNTIKPFVGAIATIGLAMIPGVGVIIAGMVGGAIGAAVNGGNILQGAIFGAFSGAVGGIGSWQGFLVKGMLGGMQSAINGGSFGQGFLAAGIGSLIGGGDTNGFTWPGFIQSAVAGGVASEITGGKFKNGAAGAAFMYAVSVGIQKIEAGGDIVTAQKNGGDSEEVNDFKTVPKELMKDLATKLELPEGEYSAQFVSATEIEKRTNGQPAWGTVDIKNGYVILMDISLGDKMDGTRFIQTISEEMVHVWQFKSGYARLLPAAPINRYALESEATSWVMGHAEVLGLKTNSADYRDYVKVNRMWETKWKKSVYP